MQAKTVLFIRSLIFNIAFYLVLIIYMMFAIVTFFLPPIAIVRVAQFWSRTMIWQLRVICNIRVEYRGLEKIPRGPLMVAAKHGRRLRCCSTSTSRCSSSSAN